MLTHLIILLDDTSVSYCHYNANKKERHLIDLDVLKEGIKFAMKENLNIQFVFPDYRLPIEYTEAVETIDHSKVKPFTMADGADIIILDDWKNTSEDVLANRTCLIKTSRKEMSINHKQIEVLLSKVTRLNIVLNDIESFSDEGVNDYQQLLDSFADFIAEQYSKGCTPQLNLITDRLMLREMNNCNAGWNNITLAPNGKFYLCPAFYYEDETQSVGDLRSGLRIENQHLLKLDYAPICRTCDAFQCKRCIWMNGKLTLDCNTPSHQQCVIAHVERNASRKLYEKLSKLGLRLNTSQPIEELEELDPFNFINKWK